MHKEDFYTLKIEPIFAQYPKNRFLFSWKNGSNDFDHISAINRPLTGYLAFLSENSCLIFIRLTMIKLLLYLLKKAILYLCRGIVIENIDFEILGGIFVYNSFELEKNWVFLKKCLSVVYAPECSTRENQYKLD